MKANKRDFKNKTSAVKPKGPPVTVVPDRITTFINNNAFYISLSLLFLVALVVFRDFIFQKNLLLYKDTASDTINSSYPAIYHYADYIRTTGFPKWSFDLGMGQNIFAFFLHDPLDVFLYIAGKDQVAYGIVHIEVFKVIAGGAIFFWYLRTLSLSSITCITGSLMFAFSGFMILNTGWYTFSFEALNAALLLLAFEKLFRQNSWILFPFAIFLIGISQPFNLYIYGLFITIYGTLRFLDEKGWNLKAYSMLLSKLLLFGLLGTAMSSFFLFANLLQMVESPRGSGKFSLVNTLISSPVFSTGDAKHNVTALLRFFSTDIIGSGFNFKGWKNYLEAPTFYSGLLSMLLFPLVFTNLDKRRKIIYAVFLLLWILPVIFPFFRYAFWLFTGDYYRAFSFFVSFALLFFGLQALNGIDKTTRINIKYLLVTALILIIILSFDYSGSFDGDKDIFNKNILSLARVLIVVYTIVIYLLSRQEFKTTAKILLLIVLCCELGYFSSVCVNDRMIISAKEFKSKTGYNDYSVEAIDYIKKQDQSFYRIDKLYSSGPAEHQSCNDALVEDFRGSLCYNQFNQLHYILFLEAIGRVTKEEGEESTRWALDLRGSPVLETIGSVKYILDKQGFRQFHFDPIANLGDVNLYRNKYYLPLGFTYDKFITESEYRKLDSLQREYFLMQAFFVEDKEKEEYNGLAMVSREDTVPAYGPTKFAEDVNLLKQDTLAISEFNHNLIKGTINLNRKKLLFFSIPYDKGWTAKVDGKEQELKIVDAGMSGLLLEKGKHVIEMEFFPRYFKEGLIVSLISLLLYLLLIWFYRKGELIRIHNKS